MSRSDGARWVLRYVVAPVLAGAALGVLAAQMPMPWPAVLLGALFSATVVVMIRTERDARRVTRQLEDFLRQIDERTDERTDNP